MRNKITVLLFFFCIILFFNGYVRSYTSIGEIRSLKSVRSNHQYFIEVINQFAVLIQIREGQPLIVSWDVLKDLSGKLIEVNLKNNQKITMNISNFFCQYQDLIDKTQKNEKNLMIGRIKSQKIGFRSIYLEIGSMWIGIPKRILIKNWPTETEIDEDKYYLVLGDLIQSKYSIHQKKETYLLIRKVKKLDWF